MRIGFIGFGEAARAFQESLAARDPDLEFCAYDILLDQQGFEGACGQAMRERGVAVSSRAGSELGKADWVFSAVTADQSLDAAEAASRYTRQGQVFFDINSVSPDRKRRAVQLLAPTGALYVDMAVMAPVHPGGHRVPALLAGELPQALTDRLADLGFTFDVVGSEPGAATAIKMVRSVFMKGLEAITVETLLAAEASGCLDAILKSLSGSFPGLAWPGFAQYQFERTLRHGKRRAAEMHESAATVEALGLYGPLVRAVAELQEKMGFVGIGDFEGGGFPDRIAEILARRRIEGP